MYIEIEKSIAWLSMLSKEERDYEIFKLYMNNPEFAEVIFAFAMGRIKGFQKQRVLSKSICEARLNMIDQNKEIKKEILLYYKNLLENTKKIALELNLNNSLELCNLYTYLLWNGYFSKDKKLTYKVEDRINIYSSYSSDIMNGYGVCLNFSDMLTDFINEFDYSAATLLNYMGNNCKIDKTNIERNKIDIKENKLIYLLTLGILKKTGNHAVNLINENNKLYIYDPTNIAISKLINKDKANLITGLGEILLKPYFSYVLNVSDKSLETLDLFHTSKEFTSTYQKNDFNNIFYQNIELFKKEKSLLDDFYDENRKEILKISEITNEIQKKKIR